MSIVRRILPNQLRSAYSRLRTRQIQAEYKWLPRSDAFEMIYANAAWGVGESMMPSSGGGSSGRLADEYCKFLEGLLRSRNIESIADLGCGDFNVGRIVANTVTEYVGVDIAKSVIDRNNRVHRNEHVRFVRSDLTCDCLPGAEAALVRQVLQHLSNSEIDAALANILSTYRWAFITEHVYTGPDCTPNVDMPHGPGTRVPFRSGVFVDQPPFNLIAEQVRDICFAPRQALRTWVVKGKQATK